MNCTVTANDATRSGGGFYSYGADLRLANCIVWGDRPEAIYSEESAVAIRYSDVQGGWEGDHNLNQDPRFREDGWRLFGGSPAIDSGSTNGMPETDLDGDPRPWGDGVDMGADEYNTVEIGAVPPRGSFPGIALAEAWPNPFNPHTSLAFELTEGMAVHLAIYDLRGAQVRELVEGWREPGRHVAGWDGTNAQGAPMPSALYTVRLTAGNVREQRRLVLLK